MAYYTISNNGDRYAVKEGAIIISTHETNHLALGAIQRLHRQDKQDAKKKRNCMTCRRPFMREGPHNRMCNFCRKQTVFDGSA